ncbi:matrixin family metalloprotease [Vampirovibrio chlorellavorus]|uniref:matrixin family metalloprotease n=1 Tax=Vampirovibrio chlorellavorus TaxID=758823 RepID=UPI0026F0419E|nr:matrixin family metalloprotease [Vampirovibrio chlorellavorus]
MNIPPQSRQPQSTGQPPLSLSVGHFRLENLRQSIEQNPLAALNALGAWRGDSIQSPAKAVRWPLEQMPLSVWLPASPVSVNQGFPSPPSLFAALRQWETVTDGLIRFRLMDINTETAEQAHIAFGWAQETTKGRDYEVGHANREVQGSRIRRVTITLIQDPLIDGHLSIAQRQSRLLATVLHETGHALGLEHSENSQDVMFYRGWRREQLSHGDIRRIRELYQQGRTQA